MGTESAAEAPWESDLKESRAMECITEKTSEPELLSEIEATEIEGGEIEATPPRRRHPPLSLGARIGLFVIGWLLVLIGVAGLVLPGIQGVLTILAGAAVLSLVSELAYELLRKSLRRWPKAWRRVESLRDRVHSRLHRAKPGAEPGE